LSPREKMSGVATNVYSRKKLEKTKKQQRYADFKNEGSRVV